MRGEISLCPLTLVLSTAFAIYEVEMIEDKGLEK